MWLDTIWGPFFLSFLDIYLFFSSLVFFYIFQVSKWVDYSDKYGFGYALSDESIGVVFNDLTKLLLLSDGR